MLFSTVAEKMAVKPLGCDSIPDGATIIGNTWCFGYSPGLCCCSLMPHGLGVWRILAFSEMLIVMCFLSPLAEKQATESARIEDRRSQFLKMTLGSVKDLTAKGVPVFVATLKPNELLYVPIGFLVAEHVVAGALFCGVRKTALGPTPDTVTHMKAVIEATRASGKLVGRAEEVCAMLQAVVTPDMKPS